MPLRRALAIVIVAGGAAGVFSGCLRAASTPDAWPCQSSADCESNEVCVVAAAGASDALGECRTSDETGNLAGAPAGQGGCQGAVEPGGAGAAGEAVCGGGGAQP